MKKINSYAQGHYISEQTGPFHFKFFFFFFFFRKSDLDVTLEDI